MVEGGVHTLSHTHLVDPGALRDQRGGLRGHGGALCSHQGLQRGHGCALGGHQRLQRGYPGRVPADV